MNQSTDIPFARPSMDQAEEEAVLRVLRSGWLTTAAETLAFETEFAEAVGTSHAIAVSSGTAGLHLSLDAVGVGTGDLVATTPYSFTASAEVIRYMGGDPIFVDVRESDLTIDPERLDDAVRSDSRISAAIPVHLGGHPCQMDAICEICRKHEMAIVEDAAHAFPGTWNGTSLGTLGTTGVYSFYATKTITTGEGGMIVTEDEQLAKRMSLMRLHGIDREVWNRYTSTRSSWQYEVVEAGYKYNLPDILAAIGRVQLSKANAFLTRRREIAKAYLDGFEDRDYLTLPLECSGSSWHLFIIRIRPERVRISREEFIEQLAAAGIGTSVHYIPLHLMPYYRKRYDLRPEDFPVSLKAYQTAISLPIYPGLTDEAVARIVREVVRIGDAAAGR